MQSQQAQRDDHLALVKQNFIHLLEAIAITPQKGSPDEKHVSTSYVERHNLTMRMSMRRFTRLTNAFSKKFDNHCHALALYFVHYNFCRIHKSLKVSPAMDAGLTDTLHDIEWIVELIDARTPKPKPRGPYKKRNSN